MWIRSDNERKEQLKEYLNGIIEELDKNIVPLDVLIVRTEYESNLSKKNLDDYSYEESSKFLKELIKEKEENDIANKYNPIDLDDYLTDDKYKDYFGNDEKNQYQYRTVLDGIMANDEAYLFEKIKYTNEEFESKKNLEDPKECLSFFLKEGVKGAITDGITWVKEQEEHKPSYNEIYLPELKKLVNELEWVLVGKQNRFYSLEEISKDYKELKEYKEKSKEDEVEY